ncbi:MAG: class I SAM-dependent methyltransferase [Kiritimatiellia bacterium]|jgi:ubiquinone/menaquinone biosynthesis C-methylase UbiE
MKKTSTNFDRIADVYDAWYATAAGRRYDAAQRELLSRLLPNAGAGRRQLLDAGCGSGHWSIYFAEQGFHVTGIDISPKMIAVAKARQLSNCHFRVGDVQRLPYKDGRFNVVCAITVMEFVADVQRACEEILRCLKPGGCMLIGALNRLAKINRRRAAVGTWPFASAKMFTLDELRLFLGQFGDVTIGISMEDNHRGVESLESGALIAARVVKR